jgi:hypothetical protein
MVLGEELLLYRAEDAEELVRFARKRSCSTTKKTHTTIHTEMNLRGTVRTFISFVESAKEKNKKPISSDVLSLYEEAIGEMKHRKNVLQSFFMRYSIGDRIDQGADWERLQTLTEADTPRQTELTSENEIFLRDHYLSLVLLQENGLVETKDGGMYLQGKIEPDNAYNQYPADLLLEPESDALTEHHITRQITTYSDTAYLVILGPEIVTMMELEEIEEFCHSLEVDEESLARMLMNLALKKMLVDKLVLFIQEKKKTSKEEILEVMREFDLEIPDTIDHFSFHLHNLFLEEMLDDLRKIKIIQGKDAKIRYTGG